MGKVLWWSMTPKQYIVSIHIANAQMLLESSGYTIQEIAALVGYGDALYFGRLFKRETGLTPSQYRKMCQGQPEAGTSVGGVPLNK